MYIVFDAFRFFVFIYDCSSLGAGAGIHDRVLLWCCALIYFSTMKSYRSNSILLSVLRFLCLVPKDEKAYSFYINAI